MGATLTFPAPNGAPAPHAADFRGLGTGVRVVVTDAADLPAAVAAVRGVLARVDAACSRFRDDSDLSRVNAAAGTRVRVGRDLLDALEVAIRAARLTGGLLDPTLGGHIVRLGYDRDFTALTPARDRPTTPSGGPGGVRVRIRRDWRAVEVNRDAQAVRVPEGLALDLGATAKAWAVDRAAAAAAARLGAGQGVLVSVGGDIAVAGVAPAGGWPVRVTDHHAAPPGAPGQTVTLESGGIATSSTTVRRWAHRDGVHHHLLDPRTLLPAVEYWRTASVAAGSCTDANIASTTAILLAAGAPDWLAAMRLPARLVTPSGDVVRVAGWPPAGGSTGTPDHE